MVIETKQRVWSNDKGKELVRLDNDLTAKVIPATCTEAELWDLADACQQAAKALKAPPLAFKSELPAGPPAMTHAEYEVAGGRP